jgi:hypothetical protein
LHVFDCRTANDPAMPTKESCKLPHMSEPSEPIWTKSKWSQADLDHQKVEFRIPLMDQVVRGIGEFWVRANNELLSIEIVTDRQGGNWAERVQSHFVLQQIAVDRIELHPDQDVAKFRLV